MPCKLPDLTPQLLFRDGVDTDIPYCLALDSDFQSEHVWQMTVQEAGDEVQVSCRKQRLPRQLDSRHRYRSAAA